MRIVIPRTITRRGAGLGNELIPWAKAHLAAQALGARCLHPAWGLNPRRYWNLFETSRLDVFTNRALPIACSSYLFDANAYKRTGITDFGHAIGEWARSKNLLSHRFLVVEVEGMWGGYLGIMRARNFITQQLENTKDAQSNLTKTLSLVPSGTIHVGIHVRRGDFATTNPTQCFRGRFNLALPIDWYDAACRELIRLLGRTRVHFTLITDGMSSEIDHLVREHKMATTLHLPNTDISDLLLLSRCNIIVSSISSYSMAAAWLGNGRYIWYRDQLQCQDGMLSIWGHEPSQSTGPTAENARIVAGRNMRSPHPRGVPFRSGEQLPSWIADPTDNDASSDLILFGVVPDNTPKAS